ncbi:hypothetical protein AWR36_000535 [Microbulbifer flavimaris]|uniref:Uncharacterized protein n=1 Tax=Microbulbifer flavimaris TaxID=1781068 RepID=A0ABX4I328_9GAMM|nr:MULTISPECIES: hypothetical protein [Microbulbifer]KUJ84234.1 hypothetical protein AVO43_00535 [Microbulbifer sp. ZGT114]PCO06310.1 hypothetical protein AWR36_000535 [Microbulbifer flavimaris]
MKRLVWFLSLPLALLLGAYGVALIINLEDAEPSPIAERMRTLIAQQPEVKDAENAYVFALGFDGGKGASALEWGRKKLEWLEAAIEGPGEAELSDPPGSTWSASRDRASRFRQFAASPDAFLSTDDVLLADWVADESWLLERYLELTEFPHWRSGIPRNAAEPFVPFSDVMEGQKLLMGKALLAAAEGEGESVKALLERDLRFWRLLLAESDLLIAKMIASAAVQRHFELGNQVLRRLSESGESSAAGVPGSWRAPLTPEERSLEKVMAGEWLYGNRILRDIIESGEHDPILWPLMKPLFQPQDLENRRAETLVQWGAPLEVPLDKLSAALESTRKELSDKRTGLSLYNLSGRLLFEDGMPFPAYGEYVARVADLEGVRRAAVLAARLRDGDSDNTAELVNPYTGDPLPLENGSVVRFTGLTKGARGQHDFPL